MQDSNAGSCRLILHNQQGIRLWPRELQSLVLLRNTWHLFCPYNTSITSLQLFKYLNILNPPFGDTSFKTTVQPLSDSTDDYIPTGRQKKSQCTFLVNAQQANVVVSHQEVAKHHHAVLSLPLLHQNRTQLHFQLVSRALYLRGQTFFISSLLN